MVKKESDGGIIMLRTVIAKLNVLKVVMIIILATVVIYNCNSIIDTYGKEYNNVNIKDEYIKEKGKYSKEYKKENVEYSKEYKKEDHIKEKEEYIDKITVMKQKYFYIKDENYDKDIKLDFTELVKFNKEYIELIKKFIKDNPELFDESKLEWFEQYEIKVVEKKDNLEIIVNVVKIQPSTIQYGTEDGFRIILPDGGNLEFNFLKSNENNYVYQDVLIYKHLLNIKSTVLLI